MLRRFSPDHEPFGGSRAVLRGPTTTHLRRACLLAGTPEAAAVPPQPHRTERIAAELAEAPEPETRSGGTGARGRPLS
ncbi:hypothetical protein ACKI1O_12815 [Streptomyces scabiei]